MHRKLDMSIFRFSNPIISFNVIPTYSHCSLNAYFRLSVSGFLSHGNLRFLLYMFMLYKQASCASQTLTTPPLLQLCFVAFHYNVRNPYIHISLNQPSFHIRQRFNPSHDQQAHRGCVFAVLLLFPKSSPHFCYTGLGSLTLIERVGPPAFLEGAHLFIARHCSPSLL